MYTLGHFAQDMACYIFNVIHYLSRVTNWTNGNIIQGITIRSFFQENLFENVSNMFRSSCVLACGITKAYISA